MLDPTATAIACGGRVTKVEMDVTTLLRTDRATEEWGACVIRRKLVSVNLKSHIARSIERPLRLQHASMRRVVLGLRMPVRQSTHVVAHRTASAAGMNNGHVTSVRVSACMSSFSWRDPNLARKALWDLRVLRALNGLGKYLS